MARKPRIHGETGIYHIILRGNNKQNIFIDEKDYLFFLNRLNKYIKELKLELHAYCLMPNHIHLLIGNANELMSLLIQKLATSYAIYFNHRYDRCGHLFQGRFKSEPIENDEYYKTVYRYILQNPEKANLASYSDYSWNSYKKLLFDTKNQLFTKHITSIFSDKTSLFSFLASKETKKCMEFENKIFFSDEKAVYMIKKILKISSPYKIERLSIKDQIKKLKILKQRGLSVNQISRITGISKQIIKSA